MKKSDCTIYIAKTKGAGQLASYGAADLHLFFRICKKQVFSGHGSFITSFLHTNIYAKNYAI